jgi:hypothetical protein
MLSVPRHVVEQFTRQLSAGGSKHDIYHTPGYPVKNSGTTDRKGYYHIVRQAVIAADVHVVIIAVEAAAAENVWERRLWAMGPCSSAGSVEPHPRVCRVSTDYPDHLLPRNVEPPQ